MIENRIREWRSKRGAMGINQSQLAKRLGVSRSYISRLEKGTISPSGEMIFKLADFFGCNVEEVFKLKI